MTSRPDHHGHEHAPGAGPAVLDIGGETGALVVEMSTMPVSRELEACPAGRPEARFHTGVHSRSGAHGEVLVAIFPGVAAGDYDLLDERGRAVTRVHVAGGTVTRTALT
jgi:hypothetical protein